MQIDGSLHRLRFRFHFTKIFLFVSQYVKCPVIEQIKWSLSVKLNAYNFSFFVFIYCNISYWMLNGFCGILFIDFGHACLQCGTINDKIKTRWTNNNDWNSFFDWVKVEICTKEQGTDRTLHTAHRIIMKRIVC